MEPDPETEQAAFYEWGPKKLTRKIQLAREYFAKSGKQLDGNCLKTMFKPEQMHSLWQVLKGQRRREGPEAEKKWDDLQKHKGSRTNITALKTRCLEVALLGNERTGTWEDVLVSFSTSLEDKTEDRVAELWKYAGELRQLHGRKEAAKFIKDGKYEVGEDRDGTVMYKKIEVGRNTSRTFTKTAKVEKSAKQATMRAISSQH